ncbi:MAG: signal peptide peptidase SppA [Proteobacteria bacterium]|nr:signal peptide peptidase SppA [Pseudomonadota bacterium]
MKHIKLTLARVFFFLALSVISNMSAIQNQKADNRALWIIVAILGFFFLVFLVFVISLMSVLGGASPKPDSIGVVEITGTIEKADSTINAIRKMNEDQTVKAVLIRINSPGGTVSASQEMVEAIGTIQKPVAISMGDMAASGGYYVACAGPRIFANPGTLTGSIGVISQVVEVSELLDFLNIKVNTVKTGDLKDSGSPFREFNEKDKAYFEQLGIDLYEQFVDQVASARKLPREKVLEIADGRVLSGRQAHDVGLVDELGGMAEALTYLQKQADIGEYDIVYPASSSNPWIDMLLTEGREQAGKAIKAGVDAITNDNSEIFKYLYQP